MYKKLYWPMIDRVLAGPPRITRDNIAEYCKAQRHLLSIVKTTGSVAIAEAVGTEDVWGCGTAVSGKGHRARRCRAARVGADRRGLLLAASMRLATCLYLCLVALPAAAAAAPAWLIVTPDQTARAGTPIVLYVVKPAVQANWPDTLRLRLVRDDRALEVELAIVDQVLTEDTRRTYRGVLPAHLSGLVRAHLAGAESNQLALVVTAADPIERMRAPMSSDATPFTRSSGTGSKLFATDEPALSANEPMYFVVGDGGGAAARFQLSFKYRLFDPDSHPVQWVPFLSRLHFGYTQTSIWDLGAHSSPFHDTSYRPSLFWQGETHGERRLMPEELRAGFEHESNGKDGVNSRSINTLFAQPVWRTGFSDGRTLTFAPKVYGYLEKSDNPDLQRYRGYADWILRYGREDGWLLAMQLRNGTSGHGSAQFDVSYPLRKPLFARTGGFLYFQLFKGYGESLLDYNLDRGTQVRVGFSIVR